ncbi:MAG: polysaccharide deacetylase family protein, partial [Actinomycetota bacterium]|nr:polysaccharide deacetylase family protein [Actinomycetota bacterium]
MSGSVPRVASATVRRRPFVVLLAVLMSTALAGNLIAMSASARPAVPPPAAGAAATHLWPVSAPYSAAPLPSVNSATGLGASRAPMLAINASRGAVALTFDDGPDPRFTPHVLALLARYHVHATFCVVGIHAEEYPWLVRAIVKGGNALCNHTYNHDEHIGRQTLAQITADLRRTDAAIVAATGQRPRYFRAPAGKWTPTLIAAANAEGMVPLGWSADPRDWARPGVPSIVSTALTELRPGGILLMHDGFGHREQSVAALNLLLPAFAARRMHPVRL